MMAVRPPWRLLALLAASAQAGCQFEAGDGGTGYRCDSQHRCPGGTECIDGVCREPGGDDDAAPGAIDAGLEEGLVAYWPMDEDPEAGGALDATGRHRATCAQCPSVEAGPLLGAWRFDGATEYMRVADDGAFQLPEGTISLWVHFRETGGFNFFGKPVGEEAINSFLLLTTVALRLRLETSGVFLDGPVLLEDVWHHVVVTWSASGQDRALHVSPDATVSTADGTIIQYDDQDLLIGADDDPPDGIVNYLDGMLDEVRVYDRVLSQAEIDELFTAGQ